MQSLSASHYRKERYFAYRPYLADQKFITAFELLTSQNKFNVINLFDLLSDYV